MEAARRDPPARGGGYARTLLEEILAGEPLNPHEISVLELAADGLTAAETGRRLYLAAETVKSYRKRAVAKLEARNVVHAVVLALELRLIRQPEDAG